MRARSVVSNKGASSNLSCQTPAPTPTGTIPTGTIPTPSGTIPTPSGTPTGTIPTPSGTIPTITPITANVGNVSCTAADVTIGPQNVGAFVQQGRSRFTPYNFTLTNNCGSPGNLTRVTLAVSPVFPYTFPWSPFGCFLIGGVCQTFQNVYSQQLAQLGQCSQVFVNGTYAYTPPGPVNCTIGVAQIPGGLAPGQSFPILFNVANNLTGRIVFNFQVASATFAPTELELQEFLPMGFFLNDVNARCRAAHDTATSYHHPGHYTPGDNRPGDYRPGDDRPGHYCPSDDRPGDYRPGYHRPGYYCPGDNRPGHYRPGHDGAGDHCANHDCAGDHCPGPYCAGHKCPCNDCAGHDCSGHDCSGHDYCAHHWASNNCPGDYVRPGHDRRLFLKRRPKSSD
ncbi:hypothetical protein KFL_001460100 [Klebsormidium nitens]|uniref:Uncharacterized protein n=1 Tax=Klebsormidium nitens TaxID=105231 RepID=A0A1Y1HXM3_KLENI|nr:hypothetical protein KFL_001460100 [Klebsormidium nitens]|eukprot:GAQ83385.1 hypothetical protein KFL_001460100 [Klebsormidium nitens]